MGEGKRSTTSFLSAAGWYATIAMVLAAVLVFLWTGSAIARIIHAGLDTQAGTPQMMVLWEVVDSVFVLTPIIFGFLLAVTLLVGVIEVKTLKVISAVTLENQTVVISPDGQPLHSVQISTGTHVASAERTSGTPPALIATPPESVALAETDQSQTPAESDLTAISATSDATLAKEPQGRKHQISRPCLAWHHFWLKVRDACDSSDSIFEFIVLLFSRDYDPDDDETGEWTDEETERAIEPISRDNFLRTSVASQNTQAMLRSVNEQLIDLDSDSSLQEEENLHLESEQQTIEAELDQAEAKINAAKTSAANLSSAKLDSASNTNNPTETPQTPEADVVSGNTGEIVKSIDAAFEQNAPLDGIEQIVDDCRKDTGEAVTHIFDQTKNDPDDQQTSLANHLSNYNVTGEEFRKAQTTIATMNAELEEAGFDPLWVGDDELLTLLRMDHEAEEVAQSETGVEYAAQAELTSAETVQTNLETTTEAISKAEAIPASFEDRTPITSLTKPPVFDAETARVLELIMQVMDFMIKHNIHSVKDFMLHVKTSNTQVALSETVNQVDEETLDQLCLQHQVKLATVESALIVNYPDQENMTLREAVALEDQMLKHRAIAHNLGLFPEELDYALGYLRAKLVDVSTPDDIKSIWSVTSIAIVATGLRDGYDPSACVRPKEANVAKFLEEANQPDVIVEVVNAGADAKVFQFPGTNGRENNQNDAVSPMVAGTGYLPKISGYGNIQTPSWAKGGWGRR